MRVAVVHDWLTGMRGGERVLAALLALLPDADVFTLVHVPGSVTPDIERRIRGTSFLQRLPVAQRHYRALLPLMPRAIEQIDLRGYDLIVSSSHCVAKGAHASGAKHLCYCHTPMRYVWDQYDAYIRSDRMNYLARAVAPTIARRLRQWDARTAGRVDAFIANSSHVRTRLKRYYGRNAQVVFPPVDVARFSPGAARDTAYVCAGALVPYKRVDLAISAFNQLGMPLLVVGDGPEYRRLRSLAQRNVEFTGPVDDVEMARILGRARALIMPMIEDFGMIAVEAQAAGTPVIAYAEGGALETVVPYSSNVVTSSDAGNATGVFFAQQTADALARAVRLRERLDFRTDVLRARAGNFDVDTFNAGMRAAFAALHDAGTVARREAVQS